MTEAQLVRRAMTMSQETWRAIKSAAARDGLTMGEWVQRELRTYALEREMVLGCGCVAGTHDNSMDAMRVAHPDLLIPIVPPGLRWTSW